MVYTIVSAGGNTTLFPCFLFQLLSLKEGIFFFLSDLFTVFYIIYDEIKILVFFLLKVLYSLTNSSTLHIVWKPKHFFLPTFAFSCFNTPLFYMFSFVLGEQNTPQKPNLLPLCSTFSKVKIMAISFFSWIIATLYSVMHWLPRPISWTETHSKNFLCTKHQPNDISSQMERETEGERENFLFSCFQLYLLWDQPFNPSLIK